MSRDEERGEMRREHKGEKTGGEKGPNSLVQAEGKEKSGVLIH